MFDVKTHFWIFWWFNPYFLMVNLMVKPACSLGGRDSHRPGGILPIPWTVGAFPVLVGEAQRGQFCGCIQFSFNTYIYIETHCISNIYIYIYTYTYLCMYVYIYIYSYWIQYEYDIYIYIYIYIHIYIYNIHIVYTHIHIILPGYIYIYTHMTFIHWNLRLFYS